MSSIAWNISSIRILIKAEQLILRQMIIFDFELSS